MIKITRQNDLLQRINLFISDSAGIGDIQELARCVEHLLDDIFDIEFAAFFLYDFDEHRLKLQASIGLSGQEREDPTGCPWRAIPVWSSGRKSCSLSRQTNAIQN